MVYCGKPSKSCRQCRNRNIKCNKKTPSCGQCLRAHLICPGYPDPTSLNVRNETSTTMHRVFLDQTISRNSPSVPLSISLVDRAKCIFISTHVFGSHPSFHYLKEFFPPREHDEFLIKSVQSVCLMYMGNDEGRQDIKDLAGKKYGEALTAMVKALNEKGTAVRREALCAVLLMDCFERMSRGDGSTSTLQATPEAQEPHESKHLTGALAICKLSGPSQFESELSVSMFHHLSCNTLSTCMRTTAPLPEDYIQIRQQASQYILPTDDKWRAEHLVMHLLELRTKVYAKDLEMIGDLGAKIKDFEKEYFELCKVFPRLGDMRSTRMTQVENPMKAKNNFCSMREMMDALIDELNEVKTRMLDYEGADSRHDATSTAITG